jgi:ribosome-associated protein
MDEVLGVELAPGVTVAESALRWQYARSRGPGGQNVNKVNTKAELWVPVSAIVGMFPDALGRLEKLAGRRLTAAGEIHIAADNSRTQEGNRIEALARLRELIVAAQFRPKTRRKTKPGRGARERRLESKRRRSKTKAQRRSDGE